MLLERLLTVCILGTLLYLASPSPTYAYLDPGTGSYVFQLLVVGLAGSLFLIKIYWKKIVGFFTKGAGESVDTGGEEGNV